MIAEAITRSLAWLGTFFEKSEDHPVTPNAPLTP